MNHKQFFKEAYKAGYKKALNEARNNFSKDLQRDVFNALVKWITIEFGFYYVGVMTNDMDLATKPQAMSVNGLPITAVKRVVKTAKEIAKKGNEKITPHYITLALDEIFDDCVEKATDEVFNPYYDAADNDEDLFDIPSFRQVERFCNSIKNEVIKEVATNFQ